MVNLLDFFVCLLFYIFNLSENCGSATYKDLKLIYNNNLVDNHFFLDI